MSEFDYDLFVIGAGSGGVRAARIAATHGAKVGVAEEYRYGGTCVIRGCVPKKLLVYASKFSGEFDDAAGFGWTVGERSFSWSHLIEAKDREIARLEGIYRRNLDRADVTAYDSRAVILDPHTVQIVTTGEKISARYILIAVGATPNVNSELPGGEYVITSNEALSLPELPKSIVVVGGGYIAVEFASIFHGLGVETTLLYRGEEILRGFDMDLRTSLHEEMSKKGINVICGDNIAEIAKLEDGTLSATTIAGKTFAAGQIMYAIGRRPNIDGLGLEEAGVEVNGKGAIKVDEWSMTSVPSIYAVGDVTDRANLTPVAIREGHSFADTVFGDKKWHVDHKLIPTAVFSQPGLGTAGLTQEEALKVTPNLDIYKTSFRPMKNTLSGRDEKVFMKLIVDADSDRILGVHLMGDDSAELIQIIGVTLNMGATKADFDRTIAVHPTAAEELVTMREPTERLRG